MIIHEWYEPVVLRLLLAVESVTGWHIHWRVVQPGRWAVFDCHKKPQTTYWNTRCRCGEFLRVYSTGRVVTEPECIHRGVSEQFWPDALARLNENRE